MSALTGVGPSIASGSQTCSGTWPDLPMAPQKISSAMPVETAMPRLGGLRDQPGERGLFEAAVAAVVKEQRAGLRVEPHHAEQQREVADPRGDEGLLRRRRRAGFVIPKADQQVGGQADHLPADEQQQQAVGDDQPEHRGGEQREETEEAREVLVVRHVAEAVDEDEQADQRDHHQHDRRRAGRAPSRAAGQCRSSADRRTGTRRS